MSQRKIWKKSAFCELSCTQPQAVIDLSEEIASDTDEVEGATAKCSSEYFPTKRLRRSSSLPDGIPTSLPSTNGVKKEDFKNGNTSIAAWLETFVPVCVEDLAVHSKKLAEVENWLKYCEEVQRQASAPICLITGPSGAGKTAAVRLLAKQHNYQLHEWINPTGNENEDGYRSSQLTAFKEFTRRVSRYKSLLDKQDKRLLLVEDFPNALLGAPEAFDELLAEYESWGKSPLVFIVADSKSRNLNISYNLFTDNIKAKYRIRHITFNPIAVTLLQKAMKRFCALMRKDEDAGQYQVPRQDVLDSITISAQGDIRNALINLHFAALKGSPGLLTKLLDAGQSKGKQPKKKQSKLKSVGRDESITMMHALGRVFNPKLTDAKRFLHSPEQITADFSTEPKKFIKCLHANYLPHFRDIESVVEAADGFSQADVLLREYREDALGTIALNLAARSLMVANKSPVSGWMPVHGSRYLDINHQPRLDALTNFGINLSTNLYATELSTYLKVIKPKSLHIV